MHNLFKILFLTTILLIISCSEEKLVREINQNQAIEIVALLNKNQVDASIEQASGGRSYTVLVSKDNYLKSVALLKKNNLPKAEEVTYKDLISKRSLLHNSRDVDALRLDKALALELEEALSSLPYVVSAKAVVRKKFTDDVKSQGVAVILSVKDSSKVEDSKIRQILTNIIPGISSDKTTISVNRVEPEVLLEQKGLIDTASKARKLIPFLIWEIPEDQADELILSTVAILILSLVVGLIFGYSFANFKHRKDNSFDYLPDPEIMSLQFDRNSNDNKGNPMLDEEL